MRNYLFVLLGITLLIACSKGDNYCNPPKTLNGFIPDPVLHNPFLPVDVQLDYPDLFGNENDQIFFYFSVPDVFFRHKGDDRPGDVTTQGFYTYQLKDPDNPPYSVDVEAYVFNDCGKSEVVSTTIYFDTVQ